MKKDMWKIYTIMHMDRRVASIHQDGSCVIYSLRFMPYNLYLEPAEEEDMDTRINNLSNFYFWCASRILTLDRVYAKEILNSLGKKQAVTDRERAEIAISYHALSLTDVYWVKGYREKVCFREINLYENSLSNAFVDVCLLGKQMTAQNAELVGQSDVAGDLSTMGVAPKAWVRRNGEFYLYKDGNEKEVEAELLASKIAGCFDLDQVSYQPEIYDGKRVSASRMITSLERSIAAMEYVEIFAANHDMDWEKLVLDTDAYAYHMMNIIDYLVGNTDRHWGNWGFFVDNSSNKLERLYSLMDFNKAFTAYYNIEGVRCQTTKENISQKEAALRGVRSVGLPQIREVERGWFLEEGIWEMFCERLNILKKL